jgi:hypothetical protein
MKGAEQLGGKPQQEPVNYERRRFVRGLCLTGIGLTFFGGAVLDSNLNTRDIANQHTRAHSEAESNGNPLPTQEELNTLNQFLDENKANPFGQDRAKKAEVAEVIFTNRNNHDAAFNSSLRKIQEHEGDLSNNLEGDKVVGAVGAVTAIVGVLSA